MLHLTHSLRTNTGGTAEAVRQSTLALRSLGHHVEVASFDPSPPLPLLDPPVHALGKTGHGYSYLPDLVPWLRSKSAEIDAVIAHGLWQYQSLSVWRAFHQNSQIPYAIFPHGMLDPWFNRSSRLKHLKKLPYWWFVERRVLRDAGAVCFTCEEEKNRAVLSFPGYRVSAQVVGMGIEDPSGNSRAAVSAFHGAFPFLAEQRFILFLGRIHPKKGLDETLVGFARHKQTHPGPSRLVIAGPANDASYRQHLWNRAKGLGLEQIDASHIDSNESMPGVSSDKPTVIWLPMIEGSVKRGALHACEAMMLCSHQENFGITVAEALACHKPVLISREVNIWREIVADQAGFAESDSAEGATQLFERWHATPPITRTRMSNHARTCFEQRFEVKRAADNLVKLMRKLLVRDQAA